MAEERDRNQGFFLGAIFSAILFFLLFFTGRLRFGGALGFGDGAGDLGLGAAGGIGLGGGGRNPSGPSGPIPLQACDKSCTCGTEAVNLGPPKIPIIPSSIGGLPNRSPYTGSGYNDPCRSPGGTYICGGTQGGYLLGTINTPYGPQNTFGGV